MQTLVVGCTNDLRIYENELFKHKFSVLPGNPSNLEYTIQAPNASLSYCNPTKIFLYDVVTYSDKKAVLYKEPKPGIEFPDDCAQPCYRIKLEQNTPNTTSTFRIGFEYTSEVHYNTSQVEIKVSDCVQNSSKISHTLEDELIKNLNMFDFENKFFKIAPFKCDYPQCCENLDIGLSYKNSTPFVPYKFLKLSGNDNYLQLEANLIIQRNYTFFVYC